DPATRPEPREDRGRVAAAAERRVAVAPVGLQVQSRQHFVEKYRRVFLHAGDYSERCSSSAGRSPASSPACSHDSRRSFQCVSSQSSKRLPCPINIACRVSPAYSRSFGGTSTRPWESSSRSVA